MPLFARHRVTDPNLSRLIGRRRVLASGRSPEAEVAGLADRLIYRDGGVWHELAWHDVETGGWDHDTRRLRWSAVDGRRAALPLEEPGQLPDLFNERVTASIACVRTIALAGNGQATITARRNLAEPNAPLIWRVSAGKGVQPDVAAADPAVTRELKRLRAEYDLA